MTLSVFLDHLGLDIAWVAEIAKSMAVHHSTISSLAAKR
jgi:hypothetical protein